MGLGKSDCREMNWVNSTLFWVGYPIGTPIDILLKTHGPPNILFKAHSDFVKKPIPKDAIESLWEFMVKGEKMWMQ